MVEAASIGPAGGREHDPRVAAAAHAAGLTLGPRVTRVFDELVDIVNVDLVLAMDRYDADEVGAEGSFLLLVLSDWSSPPLCNHAVASSQYVP